MSSFIARRRCSRRSGHASSTSFAHATSCWADETRLRILRDAGGKPKTGFVWTFGAADEEGGFDVAYHFAASRSGATPRALLEGTTGVLLVDGYSGYNAIEKVSTRRRAACFAHVRRYFFESLQTAPVAQEALDLITALYRVEHDAKTQQLSEAAHLELRRLRAASARERLGEWLEAQRSRHSPKSPLGVAIRYTLGQWQELGVFLTDARSSAGSERAPPWEAATLKNAVGPTAGHVAVEVLTPQVTLRTGSDLLMSLGVACHRHPLPL